MIALCPATDTSAVLRFWSVAACEDDRPPDTAAALERLLARDFDALLLAVTEQDEIVGSVIAGWDGRRCHLYRLAVHPEHRRRGLGRRLVAAAEARFATVGSTRVDAMVLDGNETAHRLWSELGYPRQAEWSRWITAW